MAPGYLGLVLVRGLDALLDKPVVAPPKVGQDDGLVAPVETVDVDRRGSRFACDHGVIADSG